MFKLRMSRKGFTLVELMIVVAIIGILAALAIPAFLRYIQSSKASESPGMVKVMVSGATSFYNAEQVDPTTGRSISPKLFPFAGANYTSHEVTPFGGAKGPIKPLLTTTPPADPIRTAVNTLSLPPDGDTYFNYHYSAGAAAATAGFSISACHGFRATAAPECTHALADRHRYAVRCNLVDGTVSCTNGIVTSEFQ